MSNKKYKEDSNRDILIYSFRLSARVPSTNFLILYILCEIHVHTVLHTFPTLFYWTLTEGGTRQNWFEIMSKLPWHCFSSLVLCTPSVSDNTNNTSCLSLLCDLFIKVVRSLSFMLVSVVKMYFLFLISIFCEFPCPSFSWRQFAELWKEDVCMDWTSLPSFQFTGQNTSTLVVVVSCQDILNRGCFYLIYIFLKYYKNDKVTGVRKKKSYFLLHMTLNSPSSHKTNMLYVLYFHIEMVSTFSEPRGTNRLYSLTKVKYSTGYSKDFPGRFLYLTLKIKILGDK